MAGSSFAPSILLSSARAGFSRTRWSGRCSRGWRGPQHSAQHLAEQRRGRLPPPLPARPARAGRGA
eukprot:289916-Pyramimonas_sp.AAC.1